jgi:hypothetical protein
MTESIPKTVIDYQLGDLVRVGGGNEVFEINGYSSATGQFQMRPVTGPFRIMSADASRLELVQKSPRNDSGGYRVIPERWITD